MTREFLFTQMLCGDLAVFIHPTRGVDSRGTSSSLIWMYREDCVAPASRGSPWTSSESLRPKPILRSADLRGSRLPDAQSVLGARN